MTTKNIVVDYGAVADADYATAVLTTSGVGNKNVASTTAIFGTAVAGMTIRIGGAGGAGETLVDTIASVTNTTHIVLTTGASTSLSSVSHQIAWGTDDTAAIAAFNAEFNGSSADLVWPAGKYIFAANNTVMGKGLRSCLMTGTGATLIGSIEFGAGAFGFPKALDGSSNPLYALTQPVYAGATSATLVDPSKTSLFVPGNKAMLGSCGLQGPSSLPPNLFFFQYLQVSAASGGLISFTEAVTDTHLTSYPQLDMGSQSDCNLGGPAALYRLPDFFETSVHYKGFTFVPDEARGMNVTGWDLWFEDITCPGIAAFSTSSLWHGRFTNCQCVNAAWEMDKLIDTITLDGTTNFLRIQHQSSSPRLMTVNNATVGEMRGTPKRLVADGLTTSSLSLGVQGYGRTDSVQISNSTISAFSTTQSVAESNIESTYTLNSGKISINLSNEPPHWSIPGTYFTFGGSFDSNGMYRVGDFTSDASKFNVATSIIGGWPTITGARSLQVHPCPVLALSNCTGCAEVVDFSQVGARGRPVQSYSKRAGAPFSYDGSLQNPTGPKIWGYPTAIEIIISQAYSGAGSLTLDAMGQGRAGGEESGTQTNWNPQVNAKIAGTRTWTLAGGWLGTQFGDSLSNPPAAMWLAGIQSPHLSTDVTGQASNVRPIFSVEITSNQGIQPSMVIPLRLRLH